jgi:hypothetical protein
VTPQAKRYLTLIFFFVASGYFVWLGDEARIFGVLPARHVGYLFAAIAIAGLLGLNIWVGGPLDKRKDADVADKTKSRSYRVIYHIGDTLNLQTKALQGRASLTQDKLTITGPFPVELPIRELHAAELFRLHGLGRCIRISHERGTVYVSVVRFVLFGGYFASINFLQTGELARRLREAIGGGGRAFQQAPD